jgi:N-acyl-D-aspartate/D-glutamate deacylase
VCGEFVGTSLELIPGDVVGLTDDQMQLMANMSVAAKRPLNWNLLRVTAATEEETSMDLRGGQVAADHGGKVVALTMPIPSRAQFSFMTGFVLDALPGWVPTMNLPAAERLTALRDPEVRAMLQAGAGRAARGHQALVDWGSKVICQAFSEPAQRYEGRSVGHIAAEEGKSPFDALLDIVCSDNLRTTFSYGPEPLSAEDWQANLRVWRSGYAVIGGSDAGAHLDFTATHDYPAYIIEHAVREHDVLPLEEAVRLLTEVPARLYGLRGRGRIEEGAHADLAIFDRATLSSGVMRTRFDLPAGAGRLFSSPKGMHAVVVGGQIVVQDGEVTGTPSGRLLRAGRDTETPVLV